MWQAVTSSVMLESDLSEAETPVLFMVGSGNNASISLLVIIQELDSVILHTLFLTSNPLILQVLRLYFTSSLVPHHIFSHQLGTVSNLFILLTNP